MESGFSGWNLVWYLVQFEFKQKSCHKVGVGPILVWNYTFLLCFNSEGLDLDALPHLEGHSLDILTHLEGLNVDTLTFSQRCIARANLPFFLFSGSVESNIVERYSLSLDIKQCPLLPHELAVDQTRPGQACECMILLHNCSLYYFHAKPHRAGSPVTPAPHLRE